MPERELPEELQREDDEIGGPSNLLGEFFFFLFFFDIFSVFFICLVFYCFIGLTSGGHCQFRC